MENSSYFESLDAKAKERYREKLSCVGLSIQEDPYLPTNDARSTYFYMQLVYLDGIMYFGNIAYG